MSDLSILTRLIIMTDLSLQENYFLTVSPFSV